MSERIFVSGVQKELHAERQAVRDFVHGDALLRRYFEVFLFEEQPASDRRTDQVYLDEVGRCSIYLGLFGDEYGSEDGSGVSPTEREFDRATALGKEHGHPGLLEVLLPALPRDLNWPFEMDIAGALDLLGDPGAVSSLVELLDVGRPAAAAESDVLGFSDRLPRLFARIRAALALGRFDTPEARDALSGCLADPDEELVAACRAALYRLTGSDEHAQALRAGLEHSLPYTALILRTYLEERVATDAALQLLAEIPEAPSSAEEASGSAEPARGASPPTGP
jgi:hypothetical protein